MIVQTSTTTAGHARVGAPRRFTRIRRVPPFIEPLTTAIAEAEKSWMFAIFYHQIQDVGTADDKYKPTFGGDS